MGDAIRAEPSRIESGRAKPEPKPMPDSRPNEWMRVCVCVRLVHMWTRIMAWVMNSHHCFSLIRLFVSMVLISTIKSNSLDGCQMNARLQPNNEAVAVPMSSHKRTPRTQCVNPTKRNRTTTNNKEWKNNYTKPYYVCNKLPRSVRLMLSSALICELGLYEHGNCVCACDFFFILAVLFINIIVIIKWDIRWH